MATVPAGSRTGNPSPRPPASIRQTVTAGSSDNRAASTEPAEPPPAITKSNIPAMSDPPPIAAIVTTTRQGQKPCRSVTAIDAAPADAG